MHILHINDSLERGGAETLLVNTVQAIAQLHPNVEQTVVTLYDKGDLKHQVLGLANYHSLNFSLANFLSAILKLKRIIKEGKVTVVHSHLLHSTFISRLVLPKHVGLVTTYHSVFYERSMVTYARKERYLDRLTYNKKFISLFVSDAVRENIIAAIGIKENEQVLVNFASTSFVPSYTWNSEQNLSIVMVGNLHEIKNHSFAIEALSYLKHLPIRIDIYGEGNLRHALERQIKESGANVTLKGAHSMTSEILNRYDLFLMTSLHEGMPISLLEAMQAGLPSLLNNLPMLKQTAGGGAIFYKCNDLQSLIENMKFILKNKNILKNISQLSLAQSKKYSAGTYVNMLLGIYSKAKELSVVNL